MTCKLFIESINKTLHDINQAQNKSTLNKIPWKFHGINETQNKKHTGENPMGRIFLGPATQSLNQEAKHSLAQILDMIHSNRIKLWNIPEKSNI